jgi:hypothetical protein
MRTKTVYSYLFENCVLGTLVSIIFVLCFACCGVSSLCVGNSGSEVDCVTCTDGLYFVILCVCSAIFIYKGGEVCSEMGDTAP